MSKRKEFNDAGVINQVLKIRQDLPVIGGKKLHYLLRKTLLRSGHTCLGRDRLFDLLREHNLLIKRKRKYAITTNSNHPFKKYGNLVKSISVRRNNQLWVSDITYVRVNNNFAYLSLITDVNSRMIVGYHLSDSLALKGTYTALKNALKVAKPEIHHSDRGSQYCSHKYTKELKRHKVKISMTQDGNCYDNAIAERVNGILKQQFGLDSRFRNFENAKLAVKQAVKSYNYLRPHWSLQLMVPAEVYFKATG